MTIIDEDQWRDPPAPLVMHAGEVHVWIAEEHHLVDRLHGYAATLSADERNRAARFRLDADSRAFVLRRGALRALLGAYLGAAAGELCFRYGPNGKPELLQSGDSGGDVLFNSSRSGRYIMIAVSANVPIGIDVERIRPLPDLECMAREILSDNELSHFRRLSEAEKSNAFFRAWVSKEAFLKALGKGLSCPPRSVEIVSGDASHPRVETVDGKRRVESDWSLHPLRPAPDAIAVLATGAREPVLRRYRMGRPTPPRA